MLAQHRSGVTPLVKQCGFLDRRPWKGQVRRGYTGGFSCTCGCLDASLASTTDWQRTPPENQVDLILKIFINSLVSFMRLFFILIYLHIIHPKGLYINLILGHKLMKYVSFQGQGFPASIVWWGCLMFACLCSVVLLITREVGHFYPLCISWDLVKVLANGLPSDMEQCYLWAGLLPVKDVPVFFPPPTVICNSLGGGIS